MKEAEIFNLNYRRQYLISPENISCPFNHKIIHLDKNYRLYVHPDLPVTEYSREGTSITLLGDMFDYRKKASNNDILQDIFTIDFSQLIKNTFQYSGKFLLLFMQDGRLKLLHDATAMRKVFYCNMQGKIFFASQPHLLARVLSLPVTQNPSKKAYYASAVFRQLNHGNIGNMTIYDDILQLLPGHYFDASVNQALRYWPDKKIESGVPDTTAIQCALMLKGFLTNMALRYNLMLPVTSGKDSRTIMAATRNLKHQVYYYLNMGIHLNSKSPDVLIPKSLLSNQHLTFHQVDPYPVVDEDFKRIYFSNNPFASDVFLPVIYNYYLKYSHRVNLPGNISFEPFFRYKFQHTKLTPENIAKINHTYSFEFAVEYYRKWIPEYFEVSRQSNIHIMSLLYYDERLTNKVAQIQCDKEIAQEEFNPFNSIGLMELFFSVDYRSMMPPEYVFNRKIIDILWPGLSSAPINPSGVNTIKKVLSQMGLLNLIYLW